MHLQEKTLFDLDLEVGQQIVAEYLPHHVIHAPAKFEVSMSEGLGDEFTKECIILPLTLTFGPRSFEMLPSIHCIM